MTRTPSCAPLAHGALLLLIFLACPNPTGATILVMEGQYGGSGHSPGTYGVLSNGFTIADEYGDRVTSRRQNDVVSDDFGGTDWYNFEYDEMGEGFTPNVEVDWPVTSPGRGATRHWATAGTLTRVAYPSSGDLGPGHAYLTFRADPGYLVKLMSLEIGRFNELPADVTVNVYETSDPLSRILLYSGAYALVTGSRPATVTPDAIGSQITLEMHFQDQGSLFNWAFDSVKFAQQPVPEPASLLMALLLLSVDRSRRERKRR